MAAVHVAVGVIHDGSGRILIARRAEDSHQGGLWEFPGGKVEAGESVQQALSRELVEELDISIGPCSALLEVAHDYGDKSVLLDVHLIHSFTGLARGVEGQAIRWVQVADLREYTFPAANAPIVDAVIAALAS